MTACATRAPLQPLTDTRHNMPEVRRSTRRSGGGLRDDGAGEGTGKTGGRAGKRKLADNDEEDDDGFTFKRAKPKRAKPGRPAKSDEADQADQAPQLVVPKARKARRDQPRERTPEAKATTKIALPFADTPVIRRNKEMRKGGEGSSRRSSLSMRGRRASSLIESGTSNALPHSEVDSAEFYKHIEGGLPEPRRMKQLLTWCGTRALGDKVESKDHAVLAAREIQEQLLSDFSTRSELSEWFSREDTGHAAPRKPNPKNLANQTRIRGLEAQMARLKAERAQWESLLNPAPPAQPPSFPALPLPASALSATNLSTADARPLTALQPPGSETQPADAPADPSAPAPAPTAAAATRLTAALARAEFETDKLADGAHVVAELLRNADAAGRAVLRGCAAALDERSRSRGGSGSGSGGDEGGGDAEPGELGARDVLRALSRVVER